MVLSQNAKSVLLIDRSECVISGFLAFQNPLEWFCHNFLLFISVAKHKCKLCKDAAVAASSAVSVCHHLLTFR